MKFQVFDPGFRSWLYSYMPLNKCFIPSPPLKPHLPPLWKGNTISLTGSWQVLKGLTYFQPLAPYLRQTKSSHLCQREELYSPQHALCPLPQDALNVLMQLHVPDLDLVSAWLSISYLVSVYSSVCLLQPQVILDFLLLDDRHVEVFLGLFSHPHPTPASFRKSCLFAAAETTVPTLLIQGAPQNW